MRLELYKMIFYDCEKGIGYFIITIYIILFSNKNEQQ